MNKIIFLLIAIIFIISCTPQDSIPSKMEGDHLEHKQENHIGCQEGEIKEDETCTIAEDGEKNRDLFTNLDSIDVETEDLEYFEGFTGYFAKPKEEGSYPAVVMIHEWWGLNDNIKDMAKLLANEGYLVLAVDLYGEVTADSSIARQLVTKARDDLEGSNKNMIAAVEYLRNHDQFSGKVASMGWCFGGQQSLNLALSGEKMDGTIIYYGHLVSDEEELSQIEWPILGIFGETDRGIPPSAVNEFETALNNLEIENDITIYPGVGHAFANPSGSNYAKEETLDAWDKTVFFLNNNLKN